MFPRRSLQVALSLALLALIQGIRVPVHGERGKAEQDLSKVPGQAGVDYPIFKSVPPTSFSCAHVPFAPGMYANVETGCQAYHVCHDGREGEQGASFLCPNGTLFNQEEFACDWWYKVNCAEATKFYELNLYAEKNPYYPKKKAEEAEGAHAAAYQAEPAGYQAPAPAYKAEPAGYQAPAPAYQAKPAAYHAPQHYQPQQYHIQEQPLQYTHY